VCCPFFGHQETESRISNSVPPPVDGRKEKGKETGSSQIEIGIGIDCIADFDTDFDTEML